VGAPDGGLDISGCWASHGEHSETSGYLACQINHFGMESLISALMSNADSPVKTHAPLFRCCRSCFITVLYIANRYHITSLPYLMPTISAESGAEDVSESS
jgi:hypothetical protein